MKLLQITACLFLAVLLVEAVEVKKPTSGLLKRQEARGSLIERDYRKASYPPQVTASINTLEIPVNQNFTLDFKDYFSGDNLKFYCPTPFPWAILLDQDTGIASGLPITPQWATVQIEATNPEGEKAVMSPFWVVILQPDGSWPPRGVAPSPAASPAAMIAVPADQAGSDEAEADL